MKLYIRFITDRGLTQLGLDPLYHIASNPLPWINGMLNAVEHAKFFENRSTGYGRASTRGTWEEAWAPSTGAGSIAGEDPMALLQASKP